MEKGFFEILKIEYQNIFELTDVKTFLRVSHDRDDKLIENIIQSSIEASENFTGICLNKKYIKYVSNNNFEKEIKLKYSPIGVINKVIYKHDNQEMYVLDYEFRKDTETIYLNYHKNNNCMLNIFYEAGIEKNLIQYSIKQGILEHISYIYDGGDGNDFLLARVKNFYFPYRKLKL